MRACKHLVLAVTLLTLIGGVACKKKKPSLPPQTQAPTISQPEPEKPPTQTEPEQIPPVTTSPTTESAPQPAPPTPKPKPHAKRKKTPPTTTQGAATDTAAKPSATKPTTSSKPPADTNTKPTEPNVQISAEVPQNVANQRKQQTEDLLNVAEANLKRVNRTLSDGEQSMQRQVRNFITQSRLAVQDGDFERAYNLATKAQQLSQELVK